MRRPADEPYILWDGTVYARIGTLDEAGIDRRGTPDSGYVATQRVTIGDQEYEPGDELPAGTIFPHTRQYEGISVTFGHEVDYERLVRIGAAKPKSEGEGEDG